MSNLSKERLKVAVGLSGGVDSAVSAKLLLDQGYEVTGVFIQCWDNNNPAYLNNCSAEEDRAAAAAVASHLNIKLISLDFVKEYKEKVLSHFYSEYQSGRTPNPDIVCNSVIKFGLFYDWARANGYNYIATGHYARNINPKPGTYQLYTGVDIKKDQSYFLYQLTQDHLAHILFPLGGMHKLQVRSIAESVGLPNYARQDSVGICFIGEIPLKDFISHEIPISVGPVISKDGQVLGKHNGIHLYTIGQRHGFEITKYQGQPLYVLRKMKSTNTLVVGAKADAYTDSFEVSDVNFISEYQESFTCSVRIRHLGTLLPARVVMAENIAHVCLDIKAFAVAEGQSAVFYDGDRVVGGGIISVASY